jgi:DNA end-binding protein Ku
VPERSKKRAAGRRPAAETRRQDTDEADTEKPGVHSTWSGTLSFGLVSIPVDLYSGTRAGGTPLRMLHADGTPLSRRYYCPRDDVEVPNDELVRGYETAPDEYVVVTDEELEALAPEKSRDIDLQLFVPQASLNPEYFERSFFLAPSGDSNKAYRLLAQVMEQRQLAGIATFVMREREYLVALTASQGLMRAQALRFHDQVRSVEGLDLPARPKLERALLQHFERLVKGNSQQAYDLQSLSNPFADELRRIAETKAKRKRDVVESPEAEQVEQRAEIIDLMEILTRSLRDMPDASGETHAAKKPAAKVKAKRSPRRR